MRKISGDEEFGNTWQGKIAGIDWDCGQGGRDGGWVAVGGDRCIDVIVIDSDVTAPAWPELASFSPKHVIFNGYVKQTSSQFKVPSYKVLSSAASLKGHDTSCVQLSINLLKHIKYV